MRKILAAVIAAAGLTFLCSFGVLASEVFQTVTSPSDGCSLVAVEGFYRFLQSTTSIGAMRRMGVGECLT